MSDKISVIVPIYKVEKYLACCIDSILNQTYKNLEVILVDDGSPDSCGEICDSYAKKDSRIKVIHKENGGMSDARNVAIDIATGEWYVCVDSDDYIHPKMIEILYETAVSHEAEMVWCDFVQTKENGEPLEKVDETVLSEKSYEVQELTKQEAEMQFYTVGRMSECMVPWNKIYRKELWGKGEDAIRYPYGKIYEDGYTTYQLIYRTSKVVLIRFPLYYYRQRAGSIMKVNGNKNYFPAMESGEERMAFYLEHGEKELYLQELNMTMYSVIRYYKNNHKREDKKELKRWYRKFYTEYFVKEKWPFPKRIRIFSFLVGYPFYVIISCFQGMYNKLTGRKY